MSTQTAVYSHRQPATLRLDDGSESCARCGARTVERAFADPDKRLVVFVCCVRCTWARPAAAAVTS